MERSSAIPFIPSFHLSIQLKEIDTSWLEMQGGALWWPHPTKELHAAWMTIMILSQSRQGESKGAHPPTLDS